MTDRRQVRVAPSFFGRLDDLLPAERTTSGTPSSTDFLLHELPPFIDALADDFEGATLSVPDSVSLRVLIAAGVFTERLTLYARLAPDNAVEVVWIELDGLG